MASSTLDYITIQGFKSIASIEKLRLGPVNVLIGPNGSGKSNFIGVFAFLHAIREGKLRDYVTAAGGAERVLHFGSKTTKDPGCIATTMVDYYGLPQEGAARWPGRARARSQSPLQRAPSVERALLDDVVAEIGTRLNPERFIPFVVIHEFEGLLFSDCGAFSRGIGLPSLEADFRAIREQFSSPEEIDDSPITAPSKRVEALVPGYQKPLLGTLAVLEIGLARIRAECPHFNGWLQKLESLVRRRS
jgi:hypothetical protein